MELVGENPNNTLISMVRDSDWERISMKENKRVWKQVKDWLHRENPKN